MNIWQIIDHLNNETPFSYEELKQINETYSTVTQQHRLEEVLERRVTDLNLRTCEASGWIFPGYHADRGVGYNDGDSFYSPWMSSHSHNYDWTHDHYGDAGWCHEDHTRWVEREDRYITETLSARHYQTCPQCDELFHEEDDDRYWSERAETTYCSRDCADEAGDLDDEDEDEDESTSIYGYSTRIERVLPMRLDPGKRYFGLEIEQEFPDERPSSRVEWAVANIAGLSAMSIWKSDGSLSNGAELVTLPKPLKYWQGDNPIKALCESREHRRFARAHDTTTCGLHVHVSRSSIPEPVIAKIIYFLNEPCMREITTLVARRAPSTTYCSAEKKRWHSHSCPTVPGAPAWASARSASDIQKRQVQQGGRYTPVNLTQHTVEFRIFRGTLKWTTIQASIEFCEAVITYCTLMGPAKLNDTDFSAWLKSSVTRKAYPALRDYLEARTILPTRRQKPADIVTAVTLSEPEVEPETVESVTPVVYGFVEPTPREHYASNHWTNARMGASFHEDGDHWWVDHIDVDGQGWTDDLPIITDGGRRIRVPLHCGLTWFSPDRRTSLTVYESI